MTIKESDVSEGVEQLRAKLRMIVSHATGGDSQDIDASINDICVRITETRNHVYQAGKERGKREALATLSPPLPSRDALGDLRGTFERLADGGFSEDVLIHSDEARALVTLIDAPALSPLPSPGVERIVGTGSKYKTLDEFCEALFTEKDERRLDTLIGEAVTIMHELAALSALPLDGGGSNEPKNCRLTASQ